MYYINSQPNENGNYGNPQSAAFGGALILPDELLTVYIDCKGFALLTVREGVVAAVQPNTEALEAWEEEHPISPEPEASPTPDEDRDAMLVDLEYRVTLLELGVTNDVV